MTDLPAAVLSTAARSRRRPRWWQWVLVGLISLFGALVALEVGFRAMPQAIPLGACRESLTLEHAYCNYGLRYDKPLRLGFIAKPHTGFDGLWNPADPEVINERAETCADAPGQTFHWAYRTDDKGFVNNSEPWQDHYDIVVTGDSFTKSRAPVWWLDVLREQTGMTALNLGMDGWATLSEVEAVRLYGLDKHPQWVVLLYFEGNDLFAVGEYERRLESGLDWRTYQLQQVSAFDRLVVPHVVRYWGNELDQRLHPKPVECRYPMTVATNVSRFPTLFYNVHIAQLSASRADILTSSEWTWTTEALLDLRNDVEAQGGRFLLVYVPAKEHLYWSRLWDPRDIGHFLERTAPLRSYQEFTDYVDDQMTLMEEFATANNVEFLNLTGEFWQRTMIEGTEFYNYADVHWNAAGNQLAGELIANYVGAAATLAP